MRPTGRSGIAAALFLPMLAVACGADPDSVNGEAAPLGVASSTSAPPPAATTSAAPAGPSPSASSGAPARTPARTPAGAATTTAPRPARTPAAPPEGLPAGGYDVLVKSVDAASGKISVDVVDYLTGEEAVRACREDGVRTSCVNGYIRNTPTPVRTVMVAGNARITMSIAITPRPATLADVAAGLPARNLYSMRMGFDSVSTLDEIYRP